MIAFSPSFSLGSDLSRGRQSGYAKAQHFGQRTTTTTADLFPQAVWTQVPAPPVEPAPTAKTPNFSERFTAGRRRVGKPDIARTPRPEPGMPRLRRRAVTARSLRLRPLRAQKLRRRMVTRQKIVPGGRQSVARLGA